MSNNSSFAEDFKALCKENEKKTLIVVVDEKSKKEFTYSEVYNLTNRYLTMFRQNGMKKGDTIVSIMPNSAECIICFFAAIRGGYNFAPLACQVTKREFDNWIKLVHPSLVIKKTGIADFETSVRTYECECDSNFSWLPLEEENDNFGENSKVYLLTSGTTGAPKAMVIDSDKLWRSGKAFASYYGILGSAIRFWNYLPMSYLGGLYNLSMIPLSCGGSFVVSEPFSGKTILNFWTFVKNNGITALWLVPSIIQGLLKIANLVGSRNRYDYSNIIKIAFLGTAPVQLKQKQEFEHLFGIRLYENFALSESTFLTAESEQDIRFREQSSVGKTLPYVSIKLKKIEGIENTKVIWIKTPYLFDGYLGEDGRAEIELDEDGYFNTKDLGYFNSDNILVLAGRNRDIIKKGGLFVSLVEIENVINKLPDIEEAAAIPVHSDFYGESYVLCVIFKNDGVRQTEKLYAWMLENIVKYKLPDKIYGYREFPRTASGKIQKKILAAELEN